MKDQGNIVTTVTGGNEDYSYSKNSEFQRKAIDAVKDLIYRAIAEKLDINLLSSSNTIRIADLGCAAGPNTFVAVQNIIDAIDLKFRTNQGGSNHRIPEFQVFFNDQASNDFNQLFVSLPRERRYFVTGVPGSFHGRLFPTSSLHFVHSSYSLQCLSRVPSDESGDAWNKGRIHYSKSTEQVIKAHEAQFAKDIDSFLEARAQEIVPGGLLAFVFPGRPNGSPHSDAFVNKSCEFLESSFIDLANKGKISKEKIDTFNLPGYFPSTDEVERLIKENGCFGLEILESVPQHRPDPKVVSSTMRAGMGGFIKEHFGGEILDELFDLLCVKFEANAKFVYESGNSINIFVLLKRLDHQ